MTSLKRLSDFEVSYLNRELNTAIKTYCVDAINYNNLTPKFFATKRFHIFFLMP